MKNTFFMFVIMFGISLYSQNAKADAYCCNNGSLVSNFQQLTTMTNPWIGGSASCSTFQNGGDFGGRCQALGYTCQATPCSGGGGVTTGPAGGSGGSIMCCDSSQGGTYVSLNNPNNLSCAQYPPVGQYYPSSSQLNAGQKCPPQSGGGDNNAQRCPPGYTPQNGFVMTSPTINIAGQTYGTCESGGNFTSAPFPFHPSVLGVIPSNGQNGNGMCCVQESGATGDPTGGSSDTPGVTGDNGGSPSPTTSTRRRR